MPTCAEIMDQMPGRINTEAAKDWNTVIQFKLSGDGGGDWNLTIVNGEATMATGEAAEPKATVLTSAESWVGMTTGTLNPMQLFMSGQLQVQGNIADVMKMNDPNVFKKEG